MHACRQTCLHAISHACIHRSFTNGHRYRHWHVDTPLCKGKRIHAHTVLLQSRSGFGTIPVKIAHVRIRIDVLADIGQTSAGFAPNVPEYGTHTHTQHLPIWPEIGQLRADFDRCWAEFDQNRLYLARNRQIVARHRPQTRPTSAHSSAQIRLSQLATPLGFWTSTPPSVLGRARPPPLGSPPLWVSHLPHHAHTSDLAPRLSPD